LNKKRPTKQNSRQKTYSGYVELLDFDSALKKYNQYLIKKFIGMSRYSSGKTVLDFGAGLGSLADLWLLHTSVKPDCVEIDEVSQRDLKSKGYVVYPDLEDVSQKYDIVYCSNVLEHIEQDFDTISNFRRVMKSSSIVVIYVPALQFLFSDLDHKVGHYRRYSKSDLVAKFEGNGFEVISCDFVDSIGVIASLAIKLFGWRSTLNIGSKRSVQFYDRFIFPLSTYLDLLGLQKVIGKNLFLVARIGVEGLHK
jgi:hypothetical protein